MTKEEVLKLQSGDEIYWNDSDEDSCSRIYKINTIECIDSGDEDPIVLITEQDGSVLQCYASELS